MRPAQLPACGKQRAPSLVLRFPRACYTPRSAWLALAHTAQAGRLRPHARMSRAEQRTSADAELKAVIDARLPRVGASHTAQVRYAGSPRRDGVRGRAGMHPTHTAAREQHFDAALHATQVRCAGVHCLRVRLRQLRLGPCWRLRRRAGDARSTQRVLTLATLSRRRPRRAWAPRWTLLRRRWTRPAQPAPRLRLRRWTACTRRFSPCERLWQPRTAHWRASAIRSTVRARCLLPALRFV